MKKAVLFDFDYTLGDSTGGIVLSTNYALEKLGYETKTEQQIRKMVGLSLRDTFMTLMDSRDEEAAAQFAVYFKEKADEVMVANTSLYEGVRSMLRQLKQEGYLVGIITTKYRRRIISIFEKYNALNLLDIIVGGEDVEKEKPDPEGLLRAINNLNLSADEILYVGDSLVDAKTAMNGAVDFVAVLTGTTTQEDFEPFPHVLIAPTVLEVKTFLNLR